MATLTVCLVSGGANPLYSMKCSDGPSKNNITPAQFNTTAATVTCNGKDVTLLSASPNVGGTASVRIGPAKTGSVVTTTFAQDNTGVCAVVGGGSQ